MVSKTDNLFNISKNINRPLRYIICLFRKRNFHRTNKDRKSNLDCYGLFRFLFSWFFVFCDFLIDWQHKNTMTTERKLYVIEGKVYIIFGLEIVKWFTLVCADLFKMRRCKACDFFKLWRQMMNTAESCLVRYFGKRELIVYKKFFYFLYSL